MEWIDLRSDTMTRPTEEMMDAMRSVMVGDDDSGDDFTSNLLNEKAAKILGKEDALFVPSGTFGNQVALLTHTELRNEVIIPGSNHIVIYEVGASAIIARVQLRQLRDNLGSVDIEELVSLYRDEEDIHQPKTGLICMESLHTSGCSVPLQNMKDVYDFAKSVGVPVHLDGARIFNAAASLNVDVKEITKYCDSIMCALAKGLCAPAGAILAGKKSFIKEARKNRKLMGGAIHKVGYLAASGLIGLDKMIPQISKDNENARYLADRLEEIEIFEVLRNRLDGNLLFFKVNDKSFDERSFIDFLYKHKIKINPRGAGSGKREFRFVTHYGITREKIDYAIEVIQKYIK